MGIGLATVGDGRGEVVGLAVLPVRGGRVGALGLAITSPGDAGLRYSSNIRGLRRDGVGEVGL